ncbi:hypothetical protein [Thalassiella azotivora]
MGEEAVRLLGALQDAAAAWAAAGGGSGGPAGDGPTTCTCGRSAAAPCRVCPVCRVVERVQRLRPEAVHHVAEAATALLVALSDLLADEPGGTGAPDVPVGEPADAPADQPADEPADEPGTGRNPPQDGHGGHHGRGTWDGGPPVQRIPVTEDDTSGGPGG